MHNLHLQEALQSLATLLNHLVREAVGKDLSRKRGDVDSGGLSLQHIPEPFKIRIAATNTRGLQLKGWDIGLDMQDTVISTERRSVLRKEEGGDEKEKKGLSIFYERMDGKEKRETLGVCGSGPWCAA